METTLFQLMKNTTPTFENDENVNNSFSPCNNLNHFGEDEEYEYKLWKCLLHHQLVFIFGGVGLILVCCIGCVLNILSIIVLLQKKMRSTPINILLIGLQISDFFVVFSRIFSQGVRFTVLWIDPNHPTTYNGFVWVVFITRNTGLVALFSTIYFTIMITIERYVAVCYPLKATSFSTNRAKLWCVCVGIIAALFALPFFMSEKVDYDSNKKTYVVNETEFANTLFFHYHWIYACPIMFTLLPITLLVFLNFRIYCHIRKAKIARALLQEAQRRNSTASQDNSLTYLLFSIVITFLICELFVVIQSLSDVLGFSTKTWIYLFITPISLTLVVMNSSANFFYYCVFGKNFRSELVNVFKNNIIHKIFNCQQSREQGGESQHQVRPMFNSTSINSTQTQDTQV